MRMISVTDVEVRWRWNMAEIVELIFELIILAGFIVLVYMDAPMRFIFLSGVLYLAFVIRHSKDGG